MTDTSLRMFPRKIKQVSRWILLFIVTSLLLIERTKNCKKPVNIGNEYVERTFIQPSHYRLANKTREMFSNQLHTGSNRSLQKYFSNFNIKLLNKIKVPPSKSELIETRATDEDVAPIRKSTVKQLRMNETASIKPSIPDDVEMTCEEIRERIEEARSNANYNFRTQREENASGNRGIYITKLTDQKGKLIHVVVKQATMKNATSEPEVYRYRSAIREIENLRKLRALSWKGVPDLLGSCITPTEVTYVVTLVSGVPICRVGNGNDQECSMGSEIREMIKMNSNPELAMMTWVSKVTCFFKQFEEHHVFMEDISGFNLYVIPHSLDIYIVDADSLLFYGNISILSRSSCRSDQDCPRPSGNLWRSGALNHKIYYACREMMGYCVNNTCRGYDASLHACGIARWLISPMRTSVSDRVYNDFRHIMHCLMAAEPTMRCSMEESCVKANEILKKYSDFQP